MNATARLFLWTALPAGFAQAQPPAPAPTSSLMVQAQAQSAPAPAAPSALDAISLFAVTPAEDRDFHEHDLVQIIVRETSTALSHHELNTKKNVNFQGDVTQWPNLELSNLLNGWLRAGNTDDLPAVDLQFRKDFKGTGDYKRRDDFTARLTAEVVEVLPNGNLILESRTRMKQDDEEFVLKVTGLCRSADVTAANSVLSSQLHDLKVEKVNTGELKTANKKGLFTKILDVLFAF